MRILTLFALTALVFGCDGSSGGPGNPGPQPGGGEPGDWPGGSMGDWEDGDGVDEQWERSPGSGNGGGDADGMSAAGGVADESEGATRGGEGGEPAPAPPPGAPDDRNQAGGLEGGEIDDNDDFAAFLDYAAGALESFGEDPSVHWLDVSRRHLITVRDRAGLTVPDATVRVSRDGDLVAWGRTRADGRFAFFPGAYGDDGADYLVEASRGDISGRGVLGADEGLDIRLDGHRVDDPVFRVDVAFIVDATGSMGEEIGRIKTTITDIAGQVAESGYTPDLRFALVSYRDRGDEFVTHAVNFTDDVQAFQGVVNGLEAGGGGDFPEALNEALHEGMRRLDWRQEATLRLAFVVADAPAHHYEQVQYTYDHAMLDAATMGVKLFPIASGGSDGIAELQFRQLAQFTLGHFIFITEGGGSSHGSGGSEYEVDPADFVVEKLDALVVRLIEDEMTAWHQAPNQL